MVGKLFCFVLGVVVKSWEWLLSLGRVLYEMWFCSHRLRKTRYGAHISGLVSSRMESLCMVRLGDVLGLLLF